MHEPATAMAPPAEGVRMVRYLSSRVVGEVEVTHAAVREVVKADLRAKADGLVENPPKPGIHPLPNAFIHAMPAFVEPQQVAGMKWVSGFPDNPRRGLPYIAGVIVLNDASTGLPTTIMDASRVTALRTACVSAVAIELLRKAPPERVAVIGCGVQGRTHLEMLGELFPGLTEVRLYDAIASVSEAAEREYATLGNYRAVPTLEDAVRAADVIVTAVAEREQGDVIREEWLDEAALLVPLANDFGWAPEALSSSSALIVDDTAQYEHFREIGELARSDGCPAPIELCDVLVGRADVPGIGRSRVYALNLGLAIHDVAVAAHVAQRAEESGYGQLLEP